MATKDIATNIAFQNLITENQKKYEDLRKRQRTITSSPRTLRVNRRNKYTVVNQKTTRTKFKTGFVPSKPASLTLPSLSPPVNSPVNGSPKRVRLRRFQKPRSAPLSERTFRKDHHSSHARIRTFVGSSPEVRNVKRRHTFKKNVSQRVSKTTEMWLPSLKKTSFTNLERPFLRPLNAIEQLLNDEIVEPTASYLNGVKDFVHSKFESSFPRKSPLIYKSPQIIELSEADVGQAQTQNFETVAGTSQQQHANAEDPQSSFIRSGLHKDANSGHQVFSVFWRVSHVGGYAKSFVRRIRFSRLTGYGTEHIMIDDFAGVGDAVGKPLSTDTLKALRRDRAPYVVLSACSSFKFGPPVTPYSPAKSGPQMIMTPLSSLDYSNLLLSPGKEVYMSETIDFTDLRSERMKRVLRVRFALNSPVVTESECADNDPSLSIRETVNVFTTADYVRGSASPISFILANDPELQSYMLPLDTGQTLQSPVLNVNVVDEYPKSADTFTEFGYQVLDSGQV